VKVIEVRELQAHATALPFLRYLLSAPLDSVVLGRSAVVPVKVPRPERLAWHKMLVSALRDRTGDKRAKDLAQAAVLFAVVAEREQGALEEAFSELPPSARPRTRLAAKLVLAHLEEAGCARAATLMTELLR
jgi:hypothetical protein